MAGVQTAVPAEVRDVLATVRETGTVNMLDRHAVLRCISDQNTAASAAAFLWLVGDDDVRARATPAQRRRYLAALAALAGMRTGAGCDGR